MNKILIIGGNGSGKTTFAQKLSQKLNIPLIHLDKIYWKDNWKHITKEEFDKKLMVELEKDSWIMDGNMKRTFPLRLKYCDTVIVFDFPRYLCLFGAVKRSILNYGKSRSDMGGICPEKLDFRFYKSIWKNTKIMMDDFYKEIKMSENIKLIVFKNRKETKRFLKNISTTFLG
ncbi:MAG: topology modulation protein [Clostridia bacterium]|nr:topology modulation protein [Clostridia bacterium]